jgi:hypothetical protein
MWLDMNVQTGLGRERVAYVSSDDLAAAAAACSSEMGRMARRSRNGVHTATDGAAPKSRGPAGSDRSPPSDLRRLSRLASPRILE